MTEDDATLLRRYVRDRSEAAFAELVRRHVDLVYAAAWRRTDGDTHRAADVTQIVFTTLAQRAAALANHTVLAGWLYTTTRNAALNLQRGEARRRARETGAHTMHELLSDPEPTADWEQLRPVLDAAMDELDARDREAVLVRFFQGRPFAEVAATLRVSEDAARKRVDRALDKLRAQLGRHGITSTAAALGAVLANQTAMAAPAGLIASIPSRAPSVTAVSSIKLAFIFMNLKKLIVGLLALALLVALVGLGWMARAGKSLPPVAAERSIVESVATLRRSLSRADAKQAGIVPEPVAGLAVSSDQPSGTLTPQERKKIQDNLRGLVFGREMFLRVNGRPPMTTAELIGPDKFVRQLTPVRGEDYGAASFAGDELSVTTADGTVVKRSSAPEKGLMPPTFEEQRQWERELDIYSKAIEDGRYPISRISTPQAGVVLNEHEIALVAVAEVLGREKWTTGVKVEQPQSYPSPNGRGTEWLVNVGQVLRTDENGLRWMGAHVAITLSEDGTVKRFPVATPAKE